MQIDKHGALLMAGSALAWSFSGAIAIYLQIDNCWTTIFWRSIFAGVFLLCCMFVEEGVKRSIFLFTAMGLPELGVAVCFAIATTSFVVALKYTTVASVVLMGACVPLFAAVLCFVLFREPVTRATWVAISCVIAGVAMMVSGDLGTTTSPVGDGLAILTAFSSACSTVITRRYAHLNMMPAVLLGVVIAAAISGCFANGYNVSLSDYGMLVLFGAANLGLGLVLFVAGARRLPSALAALIGTAEPVLGPIWVWLIHNQVPGRRTVVGGAIVLISLMAHISWQLRLQQKMIRS